MSKNTGNNSRLGIIRQRHKWYSQQTEHLIRYDRGTKKIISNSKNKYKGIVWDHHK